MGGILVEKWLIKTKSPLGTTYIKTYNLDRNLRLEPTQGFEPCMGWKKQEKQEKQLKIGQNESSKYKRSSYSNSVRALNFKGIKKQEHLYYYND